MRIRLRRIAIILVAATALGLGWNALSGRGLALTCDASVREGDELVEAAQARARRDKGALPLPEDDFDRAFAKVEPRLRSSFDIIVYCGCFSVGGEGRSAGWMLVASDLALLAASVYVVLASPRERSSVSAGEPLPAS